MGDISQDLIEQFKEITAAENDQTARQMLDACNGNLGQAIELFFASGGVGITPQVNQPVVPNSDDVRLPMNPVTERLVDASYRQIYDDRRRKPSNAVFEQFHDFSAMGRMRRRGNATSADARDDSLQGLAALFRPPVDIMEPHDWEALLRVAREQGRWILVNVQDSTEFACQVLNRDCWSNAPLKSFIKENFLFWQAYITSPDGRRVVNYYSLNTYPAVFIVDPRTSEKIHVIATKNPDEMIGDLADFCERFPTFDVYDSKFRSMILPKFSKPPSRVDTPMMNNEMGNQSAAQLINSVENESTQAESPDKPTAESLREQREKFLRRFENN